jgi:hypothetical protein
MGGRNEQAQNRQARHAGAVVTQCHVQAGTQTVRAWTDPIANTTADNECDTNADTCCLGKNFIVLTATFRTADVYAYDTSIQPMGNVTIVSAATAYDDPVSGDTFILVFNESLYSRKQLDHSLINPNQLRSYGIFGITPLTPITLFVLKCTTIFVSLFNCLVQKSHSVLDVVMIQQATFQGGNTPS